MPTHPPSRRVFLQAAGAVLLGRPGRAWGAGAPVPVEDWGQAPVGSMGVPPGWQTYETPGGHPAYDFTVVEHAGRRALHMKSAGEHSTIVKEVRADLAVTPFLAWQWRVLSLPQGADLRTRATSDATGHIFAIWPRFPAMVRSRLIGYVWDAALPVGTMLPSQKTGTVTFIVARRGDPGLGQWLHERPHVAYHSRPVFIQAPPSLTPLALSTPSHPTRAPAEAMLRRTQQRPG